MKCKCGSMMELWQTTKMQGVVVKRYRCVCGREDSEIEDKQYDIKPSVLDKKPKEE